MTRLFLALLVLLQLPVVAQEPASDSKPALTAAQAYLAACLKGDEATATLYCTADPKRRTILVAFVKDVVAFKLPADAKFTWRVRDMVEDAALLRLMIEWRDAGRRQISANDFLVSKEGSAWLVEGVMDSYDYLCDKLVKARSKEARLVLMADNKELVAGVLVTRIRNEVSALSGEGKYEEAFKRSEIAFDLADFLNDDYERAYCFLNRGVVKKRQTQWNPALRDYEQARLLFVKCADKEGEGKTQTYAASIYQRIGLFEKALKYYKDGLKLYQEAGMESLVADTLQDIGTCEQDIGHPEESIKQTEAAIVIRKKRGEKSRVTTLEGNIASALADMNRFSDSLTLYQRCLASQRESGDKKGQALSLNGMGTVLEYFGKVPDAIERYREGLAIAREIKDKSLQTILLHNLSSGLTKKNLLDEAVDCGVESGKLAEEIDDRRYYATSYALLQDIYERQKNYVKALETGNARLEIARETSNRTQEASALIANAHMNLRLNHPDEAMKLLNEAQAIAERSHIESALFGIYAGQGDVEYSAKHWNAAIPLYKKAIENIERSREDAREQSLQTSFFRQHVPVYRSVVVSCVEAGKFLEAFQASESAKARTLVDLLHNGKADIKKAMTPDELKTEASIAGSIVALGRQLESAVTTDDQDTLAGKLAAARKQFDEFRVNTYLQHPDLQSQRAEFAPASLQEIGKALFRRHPKACVLSYFHISHETYLFALDRDAHGRARVQTFRIPKAATDISNDAKAFWANCATPTGDYKVLGRKLYDMLIAPAGRVLAGKTHLFIVPDSVTSSLPFGALLDAKGYPLVTRFSVSYGPSVTAVLRMLDQSAKRGLDKLPHTIFAVGAPNFSREYVPLPGTLTEVNRIASMFKGKAVVLTGANATLSRTEAGLVNARYVHLATHGTLNEVQPMYSSVVLTRSADDDGVLTARRMADLNMKADLAVLSACETALGQKVTGEGIVGLTWALFVGGASSTLATQWQVSDASTSTLMISFYRNLLATSKPGMDKAEALRQAQISLMNGRFKHPYYWAPFTLSGAW